MTTNRQKKSNAKVLTIILAVFIFITATTLYPLIKGSMHHTQPIKIDGVYLSAAKEINDFNLQDTSGQPYTKKDLQGHWTLMFFGFTNCGMVCPLTMTALRNMYDNLQTILPANQLPEIRMVSVDPDRDSLPRLKEYVTTFNPKFQGARAEMPEIAALEKQLHLVSVKMQATGQGKDQYTINHSAEIMVFNPEGKLQAFLAYPHTADQMANDYQIILKNKSLL
jgi:protein SCO1/2